MPSNIHYSQNPHELFENDKIKQFNSMSAKEIMDNCLDTIYEFVKQEYPAVFRPALLFSDSEEVNAEAHYGRKTILIHWGLIAQSARLIESRYTDDVIERYGLLSGLSSKIQQYIKSISGTDNISQCGSSNDWECAYFASLDELHTNLNVAFVVCSIFEG